MKALISILLTSLLLAGCDRDIHDHPKLTTGKQLFEFHCSSCHGAGGDGLFLKGIPGVKNPDLKVHEIVHKIKKDKVGAMPEFDNMPDEEAKKISLYLKKISSK